MEWIKRVDYYGVRIVLENTNTLMDTLHAHHIQCFNVLSHSVTTAIELLLCHNGAAG